MPRTVATRSLSWPIMDRGSTSRVIRRCGPILSTWPGIANTASRVHNRVPARCIDLPCSPRALERSSTSSSSGLRGSRSCRLIALPVSTRGTRGDGLPRCLRFSQLRTKRVRCHPLFCNWPRGNDLQTVSPSVPSFCPLGKISSAAEQEHVRPPEKESGKLS